MKYLSGALKFNQINISRKTSLVLKASFLVIAFSYITYVAINHKGFNQDFAHSLKKISQNNFFFLFFIVILMPLNWFAEAFKWKLLVNPLQKISYFQSIKGIISGISMSFLTIGGVGDYLGRALHIDKINRTTLIGITLVNGIYQNLITYACGGVGLIFLFSNNLNQIGIYIAWVALALITLLIIILLFNIHLLLPFKQISRYTEPFKDYSTLDKIKITIASIFRYTIILIQYFCILYALQIEIGLVDFFTGISLMLLLKSVIPRFSFLSDLGIREFSALLFFSNLGLNPADIISSTLLLWLLNILLPAITGLFMITKKDFTKKPTSID
ncbi:lysylphosphatidylglycerol synthase domain-containing protein [Chondrinema litorale]|uniref:lysylphosphatidylglycerol synthase domain-containing protein n=1 Tax=Chondrinema litorale TaxID=2994555 RepID=UPI002543805B|nr:lysylphosphatidylglycerol synthase domain-containing protein [Chondrinema litorale]UZR94856.1 lysylphosphatidylglycerol synthase domain-containing protein [Chondrinema litorale]